MKTILKTITIFLITLFAFSCNKDDNKSNTPSVNDNFIRAKINGVAYEATGSAIHSHYDGVGFDIDSKDASYTGMDFYILGEATVGTYNFVSSNSTTVGRLNYRLNHENFSSGFCGASSGTLTISSKNGNTIEGTFNFNGSSMSESCATPSVAVVTEGTFKVTMQ
jgi:uncharacterized lipoprotein NlpE involved in copper resistance